MIRKLTQFDVKTALICLPMLFLVVMPVQGQENSPTYNGEVAGILNENCVVCHREGGIGPMQLASYEQVRPWAPLIQLRVANREMPPYAYDHGVGIQDLIGDWRMAQEDIDTIVDWVNAGAPLGNPDDVVPAPDLPSLDEWQYSELFGEPDTVVASVPIDIPANGNDLWHNHLVPSGVTRDRCIKAVQVKPRGDASSVVHHANTVIHTLSDDGDVQRERQLSEYAMGKWGEIVPDGVCRMLPADALVLWRVHMYPGGVGATAPGTMIENNVVELGLWFHPEGYENEARFQQDLRAYQAHPDRREFAIPPHGYEMVQGFHSFDHPVRIDSFQPHGHLRMTAASLEVFYPETGRTESISQVSNWSATWHHSHIYEPDVAPLLPTGAVLVIKQWYDNTESNPNNPDPDQWVMGGSRTGDEMTHAWIAITHLDEEGYQELLAEREAAKNRYVVAQ